MSENPESNDSYASEVISSLSSKDRYFLAYYDPKGFFKADFVKMKPYFIVYREKNIATVRDLMNIFLEENPELTELKKGMAWELYTGTKISPNMTLDQFKEGVRSEKLDGIKLFVYERKGEWSDEAAVTTYLKASDEHNEKPI